MNVMATTKELQSFNSHIVVLVFAIGCRKSDGCSRSPRVCSNDLNSKHIINFEHSRSLSDIAVSNRMPEEQNRLSKAGSNDPIDMKVTHNSSLPPCTYSKY